MASGINVIDVVVHNCDTSTVTFTTLSNSRQLENPEVAKLQIECEVFKNIPNPTDSMKLEFEMYFKLLSESVFSQCVVFNSIPVKITKFQTEYTNNKSRWIIIRKKQK